MRSTILWIRILDRRRRRGLLEVIGEGASRPAFESPDPVHDGFTPTPERRDGDESPLPVELSIVLPCLNEAATVGACVRTALASLERAGVRGEVIVADNGSTDGSARIAAASGARVVQVVEKGYGSALMGGIAAARGSFILMGDADQSYDFGESMKFLEKLRSGFSMVQGCRLRSGGGTILPDAMPLLHRRFGNPILSMLARWWFRAPVHDVYCGMRAFTADAYHRLNLRSTGMEFATEMILRASLYNERIAEVPITLHRDGRQGRRSHLRTFRDGWRTLRLFLLYTPRWLFLVPGLLLVVVGLIGYAIALPGIEIRGVKFDVHTLLYASLALLTGQQAISFALFTKSFAAREGLLPIDPRAERFFRAATLERGLGVSVIAIVAGCALLLRTAIEWWVSGFGPLDYPRTLRWAIPGATLTMIGAQTVFLSFFSSILYFRRQ